jgi:hypothetical protein
VGDIVLTRLSTLSVGISCAPAACYITYPLSLSLLLPSDRRAVIIAWGERDDDE